MISVTLLLDPGLGLVLSECKQWRSCAFYCIHRYTSYGQFKRVPLCSYCYISWERLQVVTLKVKVGRVWRIGRVDAFRPRGHGFDSRSSRHVGTLGKSFTHSCLWRFGVKFRHSIRAVSGAPLSNSGFEEAL